MHPRLWVLAGCVVGALACAKAPETTTQAAPQPSASPPPPKPTVAVVEGSVVMKHCPGKVDPKQAQQVMNRLVEGCTSVPDGHARFLARLMPGGRIEVAAPDGTAGGTIPICVLKHKLTHQILLKEQCEIEVEMQEEKVPMSGGAPDAGAATKPE